MVPPTGAKPLRRASRVFGDAQRRQCRVERRLRARSSLAQRRRAIIGLLRVGQGRVVLVEVGLLQIVVDRIDLRAGLYFLAFADIELGHAAGLVGADKDHVGFDPALKTGILAFVAAGQRDRQRRNGQNA
jgi:hypothetical protein